MGKRPFRLTIVFMIFLQIGNDRSEILGITIFNCLRGMVSCTQQPIGHTVLSVRTIPSEACPISNVKPCEIDSEAWFHVCNDPPAAPSCPFTQSIQRHVRFAVFSFPCPTNHPKIYDDFFFEETKTKEWEIERINLVAELVAICLFLFELVTLLTTVAN